MGLGLHETDVAKELKKMEGRMGKKGGRLR
jgi:hypothetical protein